MTDPSALAPPRFDAQRLLLYGTGALGAAFLPTWLHWLRLAYPRLQVRAVLSASACRFVSREVLGAVLGRPVPVDRWPTQAGAGFGPGDIDGSGDIGGPSQLGDPAIDATPPADPATPHQALPHGARHVEYAQWPDAVVVYPATFHFVSRYALGLADTPMLLALHCTGAPVAVAPSLPPGGLDSTVYGEHCARLAQRPRVTLVPPIAGTSTHTGGPDAAVAPELPVVLAHLQRLREQA